MKSKAMGLVLLLGLIAPLGGCEVGDSGEGGEGGEDGEPTEAPSSLKEGDEGNKSVKVS